MVIWKSLGHVNDNTEQMEGAPRILNPKKTLLIKIKIKNIRRLVVIMSMIFMQKYVKNSLLI